ncbi:MAG: DUF927 domain-containing protein [Anaerovoracaceae bacterium]
MSDSKVIPAFFDYEAVTREAFDEPAPFEYIYGLREDKFRQHTELGKLADAGKRVGVHDVKGRYQSYVETINGMRPTDYSVTEFGDAPGGLELQIGRWNGDESGVWRAGHKGEMEQACSHPIMPIERFRNVDTGLEKLRIAFKRGGVWRDNIIVDKSILASPQRIIELSDHGIGVTSENARPLIQFIQDVESLNYDLIPTTLSTTRMGWIDDDRFLPFTGGIVYDGDPSFMHLFDSTHPEGDFQKWVDLVRDVRRMDVAVRIALAASFASALLKQVDALSMFVHLWSSESSTGKTVILMLAASVWGDPEMGRYLQSFNTTEVASEWTCAFLNSMPLIMDELQLAYDRFGNLRFNVYKISQGVGRARGRRTGGIDRTTNWRLSCLTSGETPLTSMADGAGAFARIVDVEIEDQIFSLEDGQRTVKVIRRNYGHAGRLFVDELIKIGKDELNTRYDRIVREINHDDEIQDKQRMAAAALLLADEIADEVIFKDDQGRLGIEELRPFLLTVEEISPIKRAYEFLMDWISVNASRFDENSPHDRYGVIESNYAYVIKSQFDKVMKEQGFSSRAILSAWNKQGLIQSEVEQGKTRFAVKKSVGGQRARHVIVKLPDYGETWLEPQQSIYGDS